METIINIFKHIRHFIGPNGGGFIFALVFGFMVLDFATGLVKAFSSGHYSSTKMREGLFHKCGLVLCVALGVLVDAGQSYLGLGLQVPATAAICTYICLMEVGSITENVCQINPELKPEKLKAIFGKRE